MVSLSWLKTERFVFYEWTPFIEELKNQYFYINFNKIFRLILIWSLYLLFLKFVFHQIERMEIIE